MAFRRHAKYRNDGITHRWPVSSQWRREANGIMATVEKRQQAMVSALSWPSGGMRWRAAGATLKLLSPEMVGYDEPALNIVAIGAALFFVCGRLIRGGDSYFAAYCASKSRAQRVREQILIII